VWFAGFGFASRGAMGAGFLGFHRAPQSEQLFVYAIEVLERREIDRKMISFFVIHASSNSVARVTCNGIPGLSLMCGLRVNSGTAQTKDRVVSQSPGLIRPVWF
jgi:hypothetical protein